MTLCSLELGSGPSVVIWIIDTSLKWSLKKLTLSSPLTNLSLSILSTFADIPNLFSYPVDTTIETYIYITPIRIRI